ncbi:MAG: HAMP domain-containing histidine kinase [Armatimonadetes bacterium]|nr:HAMP domain-containing histidine kinase [Armatimonadota bacterium]
MTLSLRARLSLWNAAVLAAALLIVSTVLIFITQRMMLDSIDRELLARSLRAGPDRPRGQGGPGGGGFGPGRGQPPLQGQNPGENRGSGLRGMRQTQSNPAEQGTFGQSPPPFVIPDGLDSETAHLLNLLRPRFFPANPDSARPPENPWSESGLRAAQNGQLTFSADKEGERPIRVISRPVRVNGQQIGVIQAATNLEPLENLRRVQRLLLLALIPGSILLATAGGLFLSGRALRPIEVVTQAAEKIDLDTLNTKLPVRGDDEIARLSQRFNEMVERLGESAAVKQRFLDQQAELLDQQRRFNADVSHELRTPLTRIKLVAESAQLDDSLPDDTKERFTTIEQASDAMSHLIEQMLVLARSDAGALSLSLSDLNPHDVVSRTLMLAGMSEGDRVKLSISEVSNLRADRDSLVRILLNLLTNADRHTPAGGTITLFLRSVEGGVVWGVRDTGEGIAPEHLPHLTERFYRIDKARTRQDGGTGLGLAIVETLARAHGGQIQIISQPGSGTTVEVFLPQTA